MRLRLAFIFSLLASVALAQNGVAVKQSGNVTPNQVPWWITSGVIGGGVTSADSPISSFGVTNNGGNGICANSDRITAPGRNTICLGTSTNGHSKIIVQNYGTATPQLFDIVVNGVTYTLPFSVGGIVGPSTTVVGDIPLWNNVTGTLLSDSGFKITGVPTNTLRTAVVNDTILNTDCSKTVQEGTGSTGWFTITVPSVSGFPANCDVVIANGDTGRAKFFSGLTGFTWLMPSQSVEIYIVNGAWSIKQNPGQWAPSGVVTLSIDDTNGNAANDCLAAGAGNACTTSSVMAMAAQHINNLNGLIFQWNNSFTPPFVGTSYNGPGSITLDGNSVAGVAGGSPCANAICVGQFQNTSSAINGVWHIRRFTLSNSVATVGGLSCVTAYCIFDDGLNFGTMTGGALINCGALARCGCTASQTISGTAASNWIFEGDNADVHCQNITVNVTATLAISDAFVRAHGGGIVDVIGNTWNVTGSVTGTRYTADLLGLIDSGACNSIPGNSAGSPTAGSLGTSGGFCN